MISLENFNMKSQELQCLRQLHQWIKNEKKYIIKIVIFVIFEMQTKQVGKVRKKEEIT